MTQRVLPYDRGIVGQERGYDCGPASAQNVLSSRMHVSEADLIRSIGTTTNGTDYVGLIERDLNRRVPDAKYKSVYLDKAKPTQADIDTYWNNIRSSIDAGWGVVNNWVSPPSNPPRAIMGSQSPRGYGNHTVWHYVATMGYDDNYDGRGGRAVWIADSGFSPFGYWVTVEQCVTLILPKGYAYASVGVKAAPPPVAPTQAPPQTPPTKFKKVADPRTITAITKNSYRPRGMLSPMWIGVHTSESTSRVRDLHAYCDSHGVSYNRLNDDRDILVEVEDADAPWSAVGANKYAYHICLSASFAGWSREQWLDDQTANDGINERAMLRLAAKQVASWISLAPADRQIPAVWIGGGNKPPWGLNGICGHVDFGTWGGGHTDPGVNFPVSTFMGDVLHELTGSDPVVIAPTPPVQVPGTSPDKYADWMLYLGNVRNDPERVKAVQKQMHRYSYGQGVAIDGIFGVLTKAAVGQFQRNSGLVADGIVGPNTASALFK